MREPGHIDWKFKAALNSAGLTLSALEKRTRIHRTFLSLYATGRANLDPDERHKIARVLRKKEEEIFTDWKQCAEGK
jgi:transcriptional regulator with XRE-family HTH domain